MAKSTISMAMFNSFLYVFPTYLVLNDSRSACDFSSTGKTYLSSIKYSLVDSFGSSTGVQQTVRINPYMVVKSG